MTESFTTLAEKFSLVCLYSLTISSLLTIASWLLCQKLTWVKQWREYWCIALLLCVGYSCMGYVPTALIGLPSAPLVDFIAYPNAIGLTENPTAKVEQPGQATLWFEYCAVAWSGIYLLALLLSGVKLLCQTWQINRLLKSASQVSDASPLSSRRNMTRLRRLAKRQNLTILIVERNISPFILQRAKAYLVISEFSIINLSGHEFSMMLRHELTHLKRKDGYLTLLAQLIRCIFWFNPAIKYITRQLNWAIEISCDNAVLQRHSNMRRTYAQAMLKVLRNTATEDANQAVAAFSSKHQRSITMRINHIMQPSLARIKASRKNATLLSLSLTATALAITFHPTTFANESAGSVTMTHPLKEARLTSHFGANNKVHRNHQGVDLAAPLNTPIMTTAPGIVVTAQEKLKGFENYGTVIVIDHGNGIKSLYAHLSALNVATGQKVNSGQVIGYVGNTGRSFGPHLHLEILKNGERINPAEFIAVDA